MLHIAIVYTINNTNIRTTICLYMRDKFITLIGIYKFIIKMTIVRVYENGGLMKITILSVTKVLQ